MNRRAMRQNPLVAYHTSDDHFVHVAPHPLLTGLKGLDDRMARVVKMFGGVFVLGVVAAANMAAGLADPQVYPGITDLQAVFAALRARRNLSD
jgi:hypothetical protein